MRCRSDIGRLIWSTSDHVLTAARRSGSGRQATARPPLDVAKVHHETTNYRPFVLHRRVIDARPSVTAVLYLVVSSCQVQCIHTYTHTRSRRPTHLTSRRARSKVAALFKFVVDLLLFRRACICLLQPCWASLVNEHRSVLSRCVFDDCLLSWTGPNGSGVAMPREAYVAYNRCGGVKPSVNPPGCATSRLS